MSASFQTPTTLAKRAFRRPVSDERTRREGIISRRGEVGHGRHPEITELRWDWISEDGFVTVPIEIAKWGQGRQFRIPLRLWRELESFRSKSPFVWNATIPELRAYYLGLKFTHFTCERSERLCGVPDAAPTLLELESYRSNRESHNLPRKRKRRVQVKGSRVDFVVRFFHAGVISPSARRKRERGTIGRIHPHPPSGKTPEMDSDLGNRIESGRYLSPQLAEDRVAVVAGGADSKSRGCLRGTFERRTRRCQKVLYQRSFTAAGRDLVPEHFA